MNESYKDLAEAFVTGHDGTSVGEVQWVASLGLACYAVFALFSQHHHHDGDGVVWFITWLACEYIFLVVPLIIAFTATAWIGYVYIIACILFFTCLLGGRDVVSMSSTSSTSAMSLVLNRRRLSFLDSYRALMLLCVCCGILAVDFPAFPRRFAKTESYGSSLMDIGVGSLVLSNAVVTARPFSLRRPSSLARKVIPIAVLGFARLIAVRASEYQQHVSEYGLHWNFFFTLGSLVLLYEGFRLKHLPQGWASIIVTILHQTALTYGGLEEWIMSPGSTDTRSDASLVEANREGICSLLGYLALFLAGTHIGRMLFSARSSGSLRRVVGVLVVVDVLAWLAFFTLQYYNELPSRRLVNAAYIIWVLAYNLPFLLIIIALDMFVGPVVDKSAILTAINRNQLGTFLLANVITGIVNKSMEPIFAPDHIAIAVLLCYMALVCCIIVGYSRCTTSSTTSR